MFTASSQSTTKLIMHGAKGKANDKAVTLIQVHKAGKRWQLSISTVVGSLSCKTMMISKDTGLKGAVTSLSIQLAT